MDGFCGLSVSNNSHTSDRMDESITDYTENSGEQERERDSETWD